MKQTTTNNKGPTTRGRTFVGTVINAKMAKTATVEWERRRFNKKYERYEKRRSRVKAHNELGAEHGDKVRIAECRPLSKTKKFIIIEKLGKDTELLEKEQAADTIQRGKKKETEETEE